jgi:hypothetical protein
MALLKQVYAIHPAQSTTITARTVWLILVGQNYDFLKQPNVILSPAAIAGVILSVLWILAK